MNATTATDLPTVVRHMLAQRGQAWVRLYTLYVVAERGSMYAAAKSLGLTSISNVRRRLITLEESLGMTLVESEKGGSKLSSYARDLAERLRPHFELPAQRS